MDTPHRHVGHEQCAARGEAGIAELSMHRAFSIGGQFKLTDDATLRNRHDHRLGRPSVLHEHHMTASDGLNGVNLSALGRVILPDGLALLSDLGHAILVGHEDMAVAHQHGIADLASLQLVIVTPGHLSVFDDEHTALLALSGIEEVVARQPLVGLCLRGGLHGTGSQEGQ